MCPCSPTLKRSCPGLKKERFDVILLDMNFQRGQTEGAEGIGWLEKIKKEDPEVVVILMTAFGDVDLAVKGIKAGAFDFILKPWQNAKAACQHPLRLKTEREPAGKRKIPECGSNPGKDDDLPFMQIIGESAVMQKLKETIRIIAPTDASVLILGENGTARRWWPVPFTVHSQRKDETFMGVDMGAIPETLFESELFGHKKGAFTGAIQDKPGRFEMAEKGSLFLDEIGNLPLTMQTKLLTVLEQRMIMRIGSETCKPHRYQAYLGHQPTVYTRWWNRDDSGRTCSTG